MGRSMQKFYEHRGSASSSTSKPSPSGSAEPESNVGSARSARPRHQPHAAPLITRRAGWAALQSRHRGEGSPGPSDEEMEWVREGLGGREQPQREAGEPRGRPWMTVYRTEETREEDKEERVKKYTEAPFDLDEDRPDAVFEAFLVDNGSALVAPPNPSRYASTSRVPTSHQSSRAIDHIPGGGGGGDPDCPPREEEHAVSGGVYALTGVYEAATTSIGPNSDANPSLAPSALAASTAISPRFPPRPPVNRLFEFLEATSAMMPPGTLELDPNDDSGLHDIGSLPPFVPPTSTSSSTGSTTVPQAPRLSFRPPPSSTATQNASPGAGDRTRTTMGPREIYLHLQRDVPPSTAASTDDSAEASARRQLESLAQHWRMDGQEGNAERDAERQRDRVRLARERQALRRGEERRRNGEQSQSQSQESMEFVF